MKVPILSRLEIRSGLSFVVVAGNSNRGVSIRFWKLDGSEVMDSAGRVPSPITAHRPFVPLGKQERLCHSVESEIAIFLRLGILRRLIFL